VELYAEGDYSGALVELTRAYELAPNFRILFNLGQMSYQRRNYAAALDYLTRYLNQGGDQIPASRRMQVEADLDQLRQRVGYVGIEMAARGFDVVIDDLVVGATPLAAPVTVNVGHHRVALVNPSGDQQVRVIDLPGRQTVWLKFKPPVPPLDERTAIAALADHRPDAGSAPEEAASPLRAARSAKPRDNQSDELDAAHRRGLWLSWTLTAIVAGSAAVTGALALSTSLELERKLDSYPASPTELDDLRTRKHQLALATDGLLIGTTILSALSLYLTFSGPSRAEHDGPSQLSFAKF
jgi:tetratricopeptide (TPR) repeat protein